MKLYYVQNAEKCIVKSVDVLREGILPGCSAPSITVRYPDGSTAQSTRDYFHATEMDAYHEIALDLQEALDEAWTRRAKAERDIVNLSVALYGEIV